MQRARLVNTLLLALIVMRPFFAAIPKSLFEAAHLDGATQWRIFTRIAAPLARNGIFTVTILVWILGWGELLSSISFLSSNADLPLSALLGQQVMQFGTNWGLIMALSTIPVVLVFFATQRIPAAGLTVGATK